MDANVQLLSILLKYNQHFAIYRLISKDLCTQFGLFLGIISNSYNDELLHYTPIH